MIISKSLFKEFINMPQLAWFSKNDRDTYKLINDLRYAGIDGAAVGQEVEDAVLQIFADKEIVSVENPSRGAGWHSRHQNNTQEAMAGFPDVVYQPGFVVNKLFCKCDLLVKNEMGTYDLREIKAKNSIRKKSKDAPLLNDLVADISFQDHVLKQSLGMMYSGNIYILHLNKEYIKDGEVDFDQLIIKEEVTGECMEPAALELIVSSVRESIPLSKEQLDQKYPYDKQDHFSYFGVPAPKESIWKIPRIRAKLNSLYQGGKRRITDLDEMDIESLRNSKGEETGLMRYIKLRQTDQTVIDKEAIEKQFEALSYPLFFYDYETVSVPVPLFQKTHAWQQVVVQYSCHKVEKDGTITHSEGLIDHGETDNLSVIDSLIKDLEGGEGTYVVRYQGFENKRNEELAKVYPQHATALEKINENTFDLMTVFSTRNYFDRRFQGSSSIKKVLPVMTDISYSNLAISNGSLAADKLAKLAKGIIPEQELGSTKANLLQYCKQDTWAMVRIWEEVKKKLKVN